MSNSSVPWRRPLTARDPEEDHRASTPLELFLDLCFVVAVAASASVLHHDLVADHTAQGFVGFSVAFFAIWWAWVNYSWLASAYDSGDVRFRLMTFVVMIGVLVLAAGIPRGQGGSHDFRVMVTGYVLMRLAVVPMWFIAAHDDPHRRIPALRYGWGVLIVQILWVIRTIFFSHGAFGWTLLVVLVFAEFAVPWIAERHSGISTPWHRHHIAERYELFTIIVLGEVLLATTQAISGSVDSAGLTPQLVQLIAGGLLTVFSLWWTYFKSPIAEFLNDQTAFVFGYAHYFVFASIAAVGAGLGAGVELLREHHGDSRVIASVAIGAVGVYILALTLIRWNVEGSELPLLNLGTLAGLVVLALLPLPIGTAMLCLGLLLAASVAIYVATHQPVSG
ncbi:MAG TPA: low temperature requirement protein A [Marmoricola sp.]|nr:low temperature requirement protein A [Marmoricola sp.]